MKYLAYFSTLAIAVSAPLWISANPAAAQTAPPAAFDQAQITAPAPVPAPAPAPVAMSSSAEASLPDAPDPGQIGNKGVMRHPERADERVVTWKTLPGDFLHDQKGIWGTFPSGLAHGHHWVPVIAVAGVTAGLIVADPHMMPWFRDHAKDMDKINDGFDPMITTGEVILLPTALVAAGYMRHDQYQVSTGIMGGLAYGDSVIPNLVIKAITRRQRPSDVVAEKGNYTGTFFNGGKSPLKGSSFPSGHTTAAFSVATVVAYRYRNHKWVPPLAYAMATMIGLSRISTQAHFPSDVFLGSAIGYSVARFQTVRPQ